MKTGPANIRTLVVRMLCALALVMIGFSHQPVMAAQGPDRAGSDLSTYVLPDGTISPLCVTVDENGKTKSFGQHGCEACRITQAIDLPLPVDNSGTPFTVEIAAVFAPQAESVHHLIRPPAGGPRAPPFSPAMI